MSRRRFAAGCLTLSMWFQLASVVIALQARSWWLAGIQLALMAALLLASAIAEAYATWWDARVGKMQADRELSALALAQWEQQVKAQQQALQVVRPGPQKWTGSN